MAAPICWYDDQGRRWCSGHQAYMPPGTRFHRHKGRPDGLDTYCAACRCYTARRQWRRDPDAARARWRAWRADHPSRRHRPAARPHLWPSRYNAQGLRWCTGCREHIHPDWFGRDAHNPDGLHKHCKLCLRERRKAKGPRRPRPSEIASGTWKGAA